MIRLAAFLALCAGAALGDVVDLTPDELQAAAISAVNDRDADALLDVMTEMQVRQMHFFKEARDASCDREPPSDGYLGSFGVHGTARMAYFTHLREKAMASGYCGCITGQQSFDEFLGERFGLSSATIDATQFQVVRDYNRANEYDVQDRYRSFQAAHCRKE